MTSELQLPPGFRFHPTDEELVVHYLCRKCASQPVSVPIIAEIDLYKFDPWQLPEKALYGEKEWYFFSPRDRKYPNGSRPNRAAGTGYWKATGADKPIGKPKPLGIKKALVFYAGKAPKGLKTNWIMHEYRLANVDRSAGKNKNSKLDDWVLCRIYNKKGSTEKQYTFDRRRMKMSSEEEDQKPDIYMLDEARRGLSPSLMKPEILDPSPPAAEMNDLLHMDTSDSIPRGHTDSSASYHVTSPEFTCDKEVQSEPRWYELEGAFVNSPYRYLDAFENDAFAPPSQFVMMGDHASPYQDIFSFSL